MGWGRTLFSGDVGNRLDIDDCEDGTRRLRRNLRAKTERDSALKWMTTINKLTFCGSESRPGPGAGAWRVRGLPTVTEQCRNRQPLLSEPVNLMLYPQQEESLKLG